MRARLRLAFADLVAVMAQADLLPPEALEHVGQDLGASGRGKGSGGEEFSAPSLILTLALPIMK